MSDPYRILVVDDEEEVEMLMLQRMRRQIRSGRYTFLFARDGVEALDTLTRDESVDMVLCDINMPRMDGLTLLSEISKLDSDIRSIIISAYGDMANIRAAMNRGAFDFVTKPIDFPDLQVTIDRTLADLEEWREAMATRDRLVALQNELNVATDIQRSILPTVFPSGPGYHTNAGMEPARNVGGDFFDFITLDDGRVGLAVADVSDKGVPAALFMMSSRTLLKGAAMGTSDAGEALTEVNRLLCEENEAMMFVTVFYGTYSPDTGEFVYANGGHNPPLLVRADGSSEVLPTTGGMALGVADGFEYGARSVTVQPGDTLVLYSDGVTEAMNKDGREYGLDRLLEVVIAASGSGAEQVTASIFESVREFAGAAPQSDDITCLTLCRI